MTTRPTLRVDQLDARNRIGIALLILGVVGFITVFVVRVSGF